MTFSSRASTRRSPRRTSSYYTRSKWSKTRNKRCVTFSEYRKSGSRQSCMCFVFGCSCKPATVISIMIMIMMMMMLARLYLLQLSRVEAFLGLEVFIPKNVNAVFNTRESHGWFSKASAATFEWTTPCVCASALLFLFLSVLAGWLQISRSRFQKLRKSPQESTGYAQLCSILSDTYSNLQRFVAMGLMEPMPAEWTNCEDYKL